MRPHSRFIALAGSALVAGALVACAEQPRYSDYHPTPGYTSQPAPGYTTYPNQQGTEYGTAAYIEGLQARNRTSGAGAILGAVVGGVLGNQIGSGSGRTAATAIGAVGGAVAGNAIEGRNNTGDYEAYRITVNLDRGGQRVYEVPSPGDLRTGDRVRLYGGQISRM